MPLEGPIAVRDRLVRTTPPLGERVYIVAAVEHWHGKVCYVKLVDLKGNERWWSEEWVRENCRRETMQ